jgi:TolB-like protein
MRFSNLAMPVFAARASLAAVAIAAAIAAPVTAAAPGERQRTTVAILYFDYQGSSDLWVLQKGLAQMLISDLAGLDGWQIVERDRLEALLAEHDLGRQGKLDPATAARVGKLLGARYMVLGGYFDVMEALRVDARLVEVETGRVLGSTGATSSAGDFLGVEQKISHDLERLLVERTEEARASVARASQPVQGAAPRRAPRLKSPARLKTKTALAYSKGLALLDKGDRAGARAQMQQVVKEQPDFLLASADLDRLMQ